MSKTTLPLNAESVNALHDAIGGLAFAIACELPPAQRMALVARLVRLAVSKNDAGSILAGTCLLDFARAVEFAAENG